MFLILCLLSLGALSALAWFNPRRLSAAHQPRLNQHKLSNWQYSVLLTLVFLPLLYALWQQHWANALIVIGLILVTGWGLAVKLAVQR